MFGLHFGHAHFASHLVTITGKATYASMQSRDSLYLTKLLFFAVQFVTATTLKLKVILQCTAVCIQKSGTKCCLKCTNA